MATLDDRLHHAVDQLGVLPVSPPPPVRKLLGRRRRRQLSLAVPVALAAVVGVLLLTSGDHGSRTVVTSKVGGNRPATAPPTNGTQAPSDAAAVVFHGLHVTVDAPWHTVTGRCPSANTVTLIPDAPGTPPAPQGCPSAPGPWITIQTVPTNLGGINRNCAPGWVNWGSSSPELPTCEATSAGTFVQYALVDGLDVLITQFEYSNGVNLAYADPAQAKEFAPAGPGQPDNLTPQPLFVAQTAIATLINDGCSALVPQADPDLLKPTTQAFLNPCQQLRPPPGTRVTEATEVTGGGSVSSVIGVVTTITSDGRTIRFEVTTRNEWQTTTLRTVARVSGLRLYQGTAPVNPSAQFCAQLPPPDPGFQTTPCITASPPPPPSTATTVSGPPST